MGVFEYKAVPAPTVGKRAKGVKGNDGRFANALTLVINEQAQYGWEYLHAESLPSVERYGILRRKREAHQNVLIFRRETENAPKSAQETDPKVTANPFRKIVPNKEAPATASAPPPKVEKPAPKAAAKKTTKKTAKAD
ncbi:MAG: DUF4177 domain-containing protein [Pseudomonadota bacterium]